MKNVWQKRLYALAMVLVMSLTMTIGVSEGISIDGNRALRDDDLELQVEMDVQAPLPVEPELDDSIIDLVDAELEQESDIAETNASAYKKGIPTKIKMGIKETYALSTKKLGTNLRFKSSKTRVATVSKKGVIKAKRKGTSTITCYSGKKKVAKCVVTVAAAPNKISLNKTKLNLVVGKSKTLKATLPRNTASYKMTWKSSNVKVAKVSQSGVITAIRPGVAKITVRTFNNMTATCVVNVTTVVGLEGRGTHSDPYIIKSAADLKKVDKDLGACYKLKNDINLSRMNWIPLANAGMPFTGEFDGNGHVIKNLKVKGFYDIDYISGDSIYIGLFAFIQDATVKNLGIENVNINATVDEYNGTGESFVCVGGITGLSIRSKISRCYVTGKLSDTAGRGVFVRCGGIASSVNDSSQIINCYSNVSINASGSSMNTMAAGIGVWLANSTIHNCYTRGTITATNSSSYVYAGGINASGGDGTVSNCVSILTDLIFSGSYCYHDRIGNYSTKTNNLVMGSEDPNGRISSTYKNLGWDFKHVWKIDNTNNHYPHLR